MFKIDYKPHNPEKYKPGIGIIGCGGIVSSHLAGYKKGNYRIVALCDINEKNLKEKAKMVPGAKTFTDYRDLLKLEEVEVIDIATHPEERVQIIKDSLNAGKHVLSQKPFVTDIEVGKQLVKIAKKEKVLLAVNQNGRWNPAWNYTYQVIKKGIIGEVMSVNMTCNWDHNWVIGKKFNELKHLILYDYGIHWFDIISCWIDKKAKNVYASISKAPRQKAKPPLLANVLIEYEKAQATITFNANQTVGSKFTFFIGGTDGFISGTGDNLNYENLEIRTKEGFFRPVLEGQWFPDGFHGTMGELLCAIEEKRQPWNNAEDNLKSLQLCFSACESADTGKVINPEDVKKLGSLKL